MIRVIRSVLLALFFLMAGVYHFSAYAIHVNDPSNVNSADINVTNTSPEPGETGISTTANVSIDFSSSFTVDDLNLVTIKDEGGNALGGLDISAVNSNTTILIMPPEFEELTEYTVTDPSEALSELDNDYSFSFTTGQNFSVVEIVPEENATNVPIDTKIEVAFNQPFSIYGGSIELNGTDVTGLATVKSDSILKLNIHTM